MAKHIEVTTTERIIACRQCGSTDVSKDGKYKDAQYYICKDCESKFSGKDCYSRMKYPKEVDVKALTYYYNGMSYKGINHTLNSTSGISPSKSTIWHWIIKYSKLANRYVLTLKPHLSDRWIADETVIDIWGEKYWFWDIIDTKTRFLIASHLSKTRTERDATKLFYMAKLRSKYRPALIITDKLGQYNGAYRKVFYSGIPSHRVVHLTSEGFDSPTNINLIERFHGTIKQRTKIMRDLKERDSARIVLDGFVTHYNFFMEHQYLEGLTPAIAGNIGKNLHNWGDMIGKALNAPVENPQVTLEWEEKFNVE